METMPGSLAPTARDLTARFGLLKQVYPSDLVRPERRANLCELVARYGYLPWSHQQALEELSIPEAVLVLEEKLRLNGVYAQGEFTFTADTLSPVSRAGYADSSWLKQAGHEIKLINLAGLGNGQASTEPGRLVDWLKQLVILPAGDLRQGVLGTTLYLLPFTARDFGCAYIPCSSEVSPLLEDPATTQLLGLDADGQLRFFLALAQLAGHPLIYDVLPQTGRFSALVLSNPSLVRWFDVPALIAGLTDAAETLLADVPDVAEAAVIRANWLAELHGRAATPTACSEISARFTRP